MTTFPTRPKRQVCQLKRVKVGRKFGAEDSFRPRQARFTAA